MAGIGFELRRIFGKKTLASSTWGILYASMSTVGSSLVFIILLFVMRELLNYFRVSELESLFFTFSFTYVFLIAILNSSFQSTILSRYISDKIFEKKEADICASMFGMMSVSSVIVGIELLILCVFMYLQDNIPLGFLVVYYLLGILATSAYNMITYVSALKEYKQVTFSYFTGIVMTILMVFVLKYLVRLHVILAIYLSLVVGFFFINILLICCCVKAFGLNSDKYFEYLGYFKKYPKLIFSGFVYMLGFYASNVFYWFGSDMRVTVSIFSTAPNYDLAMFLAILINLSGMIIFEVKTETTFYEKYVSYLSALEGGSYEHIERERVSLQNTVNLQMFFVYEIQLIITIIAICLINIFYPYLGLNAQILNMFMLLGMALYCVNSMYFTIILLYYFSDHSSACIGPAVFFIIVVAGSFICCKLGNPYYPIPVLLGGIVGWIVSFILLRHRIKNLNSYLMCR
jgi:uncharacterized membrane protein